MSQNSLTPPAQVQKRFQQTMPKMGLELNSRVLVNLTPISTGSPVRLQGEYLGAAHYEFVIVRLPSIPGLIKKLHPHLQIEISYQFKGAVTKFHSEILTHIVRPSLIILCSYPDRMSVLETRRHQRVPCALPAKLTTPHGDGIGIIQDLSRGGCKLALELTGQSSIKNLCEGDRVVLQSIFSVGTDPVRGIGTVSSLETTGSKLFIGLAFDEGHQDFNNALAAYFDLVGVLE